MAQLQYKWQGSGVSDFARLADDYDDDDLIVTEYGAALDCVEDDGDDVDCPESSEEQRDADRAASTGQLDSRGDEVDPDGEAVDEDEGDVADVGDEAEEEEEEEDDCEDSEE